MSYTNIRIYRESFTCKHWVHVIICMHTCYRMSPFNSCSFVMPTKCMQLYAWHLQKWWFMRTFMHASSPILFLTYIHLPELSLLDHTTLVLDTLTKGRTKRERFLVSYMYNRCMGWCQDHGFGQDISNWHTPLGLIDDNLDASKIIH